MDPFMQRIITNTNVIESQLDSSTSSISSPILTQILSIPNRSSTITPEIVQEVQCSTNMELPLNVHYLSKTPDCSINIPVTNKSFVRFVSPHAEVRSKQLAAKAERKRIRDKARLDYETFLEMQNKELIDEVIDLRKQLICLQEKINSIVNK